jgi:hypothetical protein
VITEIRKALFERVEGLPAAVIGQYLQKEGQTRTPVTGDPYTTGKLVYRRDKIALGANSPFLWTGTLQLDLVHPQNLGSPAASRRVDLMVGAWPAALTLVESGVTVLVERCDAQTAYTAADWIHSPVIVSWICEELP